LKKHVAKPGRDCWKEPLPAVCSSLSITEKRCKQSIFPYYYLAINVISLIFFYVSVDVETLKNQLMLATVPSSQHHHTIQPPETTVTSIPSTPVTRAVIGKKYYGNCLPFLF